jgi:hypothetical protein
MPSENTVLAQITATDRVIKRIMVIANTTEETHALLDVLISATVGPKPLLLVSELYKHPPAVFSAQPETEPRAVLAYSRPESLVDGPQHPEVLAFVEVWCIRGAMTKDWEGSSSYGKSIALQLICKWNGRSPSLVVSFATGAYPGTESYNGCVWVGSKTFLHNSYPGGTNPKSPWDDPSNTGRLINSSIGGDLFGKGFIGADGFRAAVQQKLCAVPIQPAQPTALFVAGNYCAVTNLNITNYDDYAIHDPRAVSEFEQLQTGAVAASVETTHGLVWVVSQANFDNQSPFLFVSAITNRIGRFNNEVSPLAYAQNRIAAHNGSIVVSMILPVAIKYMGL